MARDPADPHNLATGADEVLQTAVIATEGMHSGESAQKVETALRRTSGVKEAQADLTTARVKVTFDSRQTDVPALYEAIKRTGYKASRLNDADRIEPGRETL
jgi:copper chaperone CopZ